MTAAQGKASIAQKQAAAAQKQAAAAQKEAKAAKKAAAAAREAVAKTITGITVNKKIVNPKAIKTAIAAAGGKVQYVKTITLGKKVRKITRGAFKNTKAITLVVKTKKLNKKSVAGSLKGSEVKTVQVKVGNAKANKQFAKKYKKLFTKKTAGKTANVTR